MIYIVLPYPPPTNRLWRNWRGRTVLSTEARAYKAKVRAAAGGTAGPIKGPISISIWVYRPRKSGDLDGRIKAVLDALQGVAYVDDSQVVSLHAYRFDDKASPRVEVEVRSAET